MATQGEDSAEVAVRPPLVFLGALFLGILMSYLLPVGGVADWVRYGVGSLSLILGVSMMSSAMREFRDAGTSVPTNEPTLALVTDGPYAVSRNPIYIALSAIYMGIALLLAALWAVPLLGLVLVIIDQWVIRPEERYLEAKFGDAYRDYCARTRRWM